VRITYGVALAGPGSAGAPPGRPEGSRAGERRSTAGYVRAWLLDRSACAGISTRCDPNAKRGSPGPRQRSRVCRAHARRVPLIHCRATSAARRSPVWGAHPAGDCRPQHTGGQWSHDGDDIPVRRLRSGLIARPGDVAQGSGRLRNPKQSRRRSEKRSSGPRRQPARPRSTSAVNTYAVAHCESVRSRKNGRKGLRSGLAALLDCLASTSPPMVGSPRSCARKTGEVVQTPSDLRSPTPRGITRC
jgi:hypothetical protein